MPLEINNSQGTVTYSGHHFTANMSKRSGNNHIQQSSSQMSDSPISQSNLFNQGSGGVQGPSCSNSLIGTQSSVYNSLYGSPSFNPGTLSSFETNLQWITESRISSVSNGQLLGDKNINCSSLNPQTPHSCCVLPHSCAHGVLDSFALCSPLPGDSHKSTREVGNFQASKSTHPLNIMDPMQTWFNLPIPSQQISASNQHQYSNKLNDLSQNCSVTNQINFSALEQTDLKQSDICLQIPDTCFESINNNNKQQINNISDLKNINNNGPFISTENKISDIAEDLLILKQPSTYQPNSLSRDWKQPLQNSYIPSPTLFAAINDSPEHFLYSQYTLPPSNSYYINSDTSVNLGNKNQTNFMPNSITSKSVSSCLEQTSSMRYNVPTTLSNHQQNRITEQTTKNRINSNKAVVNHDNILADCCQLQKQIQKHSSNSDGSHRPTAQNFHSNYLTESSNCITIPNLISENISQDVVMKNAGIKENDEVSSDSEESNIIVEESDDMEGIESEISIEEMKTSFLNSNCGSSEVLLRCLVCNMTSTHTPASQFIHMNNSFPLTTKSQTPVITKLEQILPVDLQQYLKLHNSFMCRRCLNLVETVEILEIKLTTVKQTLGDSFSKTVQLFVPLIKKDISNEEIKLEVPKAQQSVSLLKTNQNSSSNDSTLHEIDGITKEIHKLDKPKAEFYNKKVEDQKICDELEMDGCKSEVKLKELFQCEVCSKMLASQDNYNNHLQLHTKEFSFYCECCGKGFSLKHSLEKHLQIHNVGGKFQCEKCGKVYSSKERLSDHLKKHEGKFRYICKICKKGYMRKVSLEIHKRVHTGEKPFVCEHCGRSFTTEPNLNTHIHICSSEQPFKCNICNKVFGLASLLKKHKQHHDGVYDLNCSVCGKGFLKPIDLKSHMRSHTNNKLFECKECGKKYKSVSNLNFHMKIHKKENLLKCSICNKGFLRQSVLKDHMNVHTGSKPYKCQYCSQCFADQRYLISHEKNHTGKIKMSTCNICGKSFKTGLSVHMRSHTGEKPYSCSYCPSAFSVVSTLKKHIQLKHKKNSM